MKQLLLLILIAVSTTAIGQTIDGLWEAYDDETVEKKAIIEIYKKNTRYSARIVEIFQGDKNAVCEQCKGAKKNNPIIGLEIIENMKNNGMEYDGGTILDPESGETYSCFMELIDNNKLKVRGFLGFSIFGRTQYWIRNED